MKLKRAVLTAAVAAALLAMPSEALAHCDTLDGPVVADARAALAAGDVTPVLKWIRAEAEPTVREAFGRALAVRRLGAEARDLADRFFFETLVRVHREGEGAAYAGLKPAGAPLEPGIAAADRALESRAVEPLVAALTDPIEEGLRARFTRVVETRKHASESVEHGRRYVAAYVDFVHYAERIATAAAAHAVDHGHAPDVPTAPPAHRH